MKPLRKVVACIASFMLLFVGLSIFTNAQAASTLSISSPSAESVWSWDDSLTIRWNSVTGAAGYYVTILNETSGSYLVQNKWTTSRTFSAGSYLPESIAKLKIWVGAVTSSSQAAVESFTSDIIYIYVSHEPGLTNGSASSIAETSATLSMTINYDYGYSIDDWGFYVGTSSSVSSMTQYSYGYTAKGTKTATITGLSPNTKYYYRAYAENAAGEDYTTAKTFTTKAAPLTKPVITSPVDGNTYSNGQSIKLQWNAVSGASGYRYHIKQLSGSPDRSNDNEPYENYWKDTTTSTSYTLSSSRVVGGYWYKFVVEAYADGVSSTWSDWVYVWVEKGSLDKPNIIYPSDDTTITAYQDIPLQWKSVSGADGYTYSIKRLSGAPDRSNDNEPGTVIANKVQTTNTSYTLPASNFTPGYWYKFAVSAYAEGSYDAWSEWVYVYAQGGILDKPVINTPTDNAILTGSQNITLKWNAVSNAVGYRYYIKQLSGMPDRTNDNEPYVNKWENSTTGTSYTLAASHVVPGYWYKFVVEAYADGYNSTWSEWIYCYVSKVLSRPVITAPTDNVTLIGSQNITLKWNEVANAEGYTYYIKQLSGTPDRTNNNEPYVNMWVDTTTGTSYTLTTSNVLPGYWYKFVVEAYSDNVESTWSNWVYCYIKKPETKKLTLPVMLTTIEAEAFYGDTSIEEVVLFDKVKTIGTKAFYNSSLTTINLPSSITSIAEDAFTGSNLKDVTATIGTYAYDWAVGHGYIDDFNHIEVTDVSLNVTSKTLTVGGSFTLTPTITPSNATSKSVTWSSSDNTVASVNNGTVTAKNVGTATITVTTADGGKKAACAVTVQPKSGDHVPVTGVSLNVTNKTLTVGGSFNLTSTITPSSATNQNVSWSSSNTAVATVNAGKVTAIAKGTVTITVTTADGGKKASCTVTVDSTAPYGGFSKTSVTLTQGETASYTVSGGVKNSTNFVYTVNGTQPNGNDLSINNWTSITVNGSSTFSKSFTIDARENGSFYNPGTYKLNLWVRDASSDTGIKCDVMTVIVERAYVRPVFTGKFTNSSMSIALGQRSVVYGSVSVSGGSGKLGKVTINTCDHDDMRFTQNFTDHNIDSVELQYWFPIDTSSAPWNVPGTYTIRLWAKDTNGDGGYGYLDEMTLNIVDGPSFAWPLTISGVITSSFGYRLHPVLNVWKGHQGIDIGASGISGKPILASAAGTVIHAGWQNPNDHSEGYGLYVKIDHGNGYVTIYGHMSELLVSKGDQVSQGATVGKVGSTGISTGPHLHFEIRFNGSPVDPLLYVKKP